MSGPSAAEVDATVRAVLAALAAERHPPTASGISALHDYAVVVFPGRLLSQRDAEALPQGTRAIRIEPRTVITPLARDLLKRRGVEVGWGSPGVRSGGTWGFAIEPTDGLGAALRRALATRPEPWHDLGGDAETAAHWVADEADRGAFVVASCASLAAWRANRIEGLRAAVTSDAASLAATIACWAPNLVAVEAARLSIPEVLHLATLFRRAGVPNSPPTTRHSPLSLGGNHADRRADRPRDPEPRASEPAGGALPGVPPPTARRAPFGGVATW